MTGDHGLAEDASQEAALLAFLGVERLRRPDRFGPWLAGIGLNVCRHWLRDKEREHLSLDALNGGRWRAADGQSSGDPAAMVELEELRQPVLAAVDGLPRGQRAAVLLAYLAGLTQGECAAELGIEVGAVKARLHKARSTLRKQLQST